MSSVIPFPPPIWHIILPCIDTVRVIYCTGCSCDGTRHPPFYQVLHGSRLPSTAAVRTPPLLLFLSLTNIGIAGAGQYAQCPDGSNGLTKTLYEAGDPSAYANVTCVPEQEFLFYLGDVTLTGGVRLLESLKSFELKA